MPYPDLVWTVLGISGGLLLVTKSWKRLKTQEKWGIILILIGFLFQVYWEILHQSQTSNFIWDITSKWQVGFVTLMVILLIGIFFRETKSHESK